MADIPTPKAEADEKSTSLRVRKKARRREEILHHAAELFIRQGVDATTMAEIAESVGVSPPTIFNYFGNKDGILIALVTEGTSQGRDTKWASMPVRHGDFAEILVDVFVKFSESTLNLAGKRIWRYAEAASIRHPATELARNFSTLDVELRLWLQRFFKLYDLRLRSGGEADSRLLARLFHDVWNAAYFELIKDEQMTLDQHRATLRNRLIPLADMLFEDDFLRKPRLKRQETPQ